VKAKLLFLSTLTLVLVSWSLGGCNDDTATSGDGGPDASIEDGGGDGADLPANQDEDCLGLDAACEFSTDCCSLRCIDGFCAVQVCRLDGEECSASSECCSGRCEENELGDFYCQPGSGCAVEGDLCDLDADCCSGVCGDDGRCPILAECQTVGELCTGFHECCSGVCADPGTGTSVCQHAPGCRSIGEICHENSDCCGDDCVEADVSGLMRCLKPAGCLAAGEVCGGSAFGNSYNCCPSGPTGGSLLCLDTAIGITRCFGEGTNETCLPDGAECSFSDECCGGFCLPIDDTGTLVCGAQCVELGGTCTAHADCCDNMVCEDEVCQINPYECAPIGAACEEPEDCCSGDCLGGTCTVT